MPLKVKRWDHKPSHQSRAIDIVVHLSIEPIKGAVMMSPEVLAMFQDFFLEMTSPAYGTHHSYGGPQTLTSDKLLAMAQRMFEIEHAEQGLKGDPYSPKYAAPIKPMVLGPGLNEAELASLHAKAEDLTVEKLLDMESKLFPQQAKLNKMQVTVPKQYADPEIAVTVNVPKEVLEDLNPDWFKDHMEKVMMANIDKSITSAGLGGVVPGDKIILSGDPYIITELSHPSLTDVENGAVKAITAKVKKAYGG